MKIYKTEPKRLLGWFFLFCFAIPIFIIDKKILPDFLRLIGISLSLVWILVGFPYLLSYAIKIDENGISNIYILGSKILRVRQFIKWEDVLAVDFKSDIISVVPRIFPERNRYKFKDIILISRYIEQREEILRKIIENAKNANLSESIRKHLGNSGDTILNSP